MNTIQVYRKFKNMDNSLSNSLNNNSAIDNYILAKIQRSGDHARRIILDPEDYEAALNAAAADLAHRIQRYFQ